MQWHVLCLGSLRGQAPLRAEPVADQARASLAMPGFGTAGDIDASTFATATGAESGTSFALCTKTLSFGLPKGSGFCLQATLHVPWSSSLSCCAPCKPCRRLAFRQAYSLLCNVQEQQLRQITFTSWRQAGSLFHICPGGRVLR